MAAYVYIMRAKMQDGSEDVKVGQTTDSPQSRARKLEGEHPGSTYEVVNSKWVQDADYGELLMLVCCKQQFGQPSVGDEQWDLPRNGYDLGFLISELRRLP